MFVLLGKFCVGVRYFKILHYFENYVTLKIALLFESVFVTFENFGYCCKTALLLKLCYFENFALGCVTFLKSYLFEKYLRYFVKMRYC